MIEVNSIIQLATNGSIGAVVLFLFLVVNRQWQVLYEKQKKENDKLQGVVIQLVERSTRTSMKMSNALDRLTSATDKQTINLEKLFKETNKIISQKNDGSS